MDRPSFALTPSLKSRNGSRSRHVRAQNSRTGVRIGPRDGGGMACDGRVVAADGDEEI